MSLHLHSDRSPVGGSGVPGSKAPVWAAMRFGLINLTSHQVRPTFMRKERKSHSSCPR